MAVWRNAVYVRPRNADHVCQAFQGSIRTAAPRFWPVSRLIRTAPRAVWYCQALRQVAGGAEEDDGSGDDLLRDFPLPWPPGTEPTDDPRVIAIGEAAAELDRLRRTWLDPEGASEAELKKRTLTSLYNQRPTWLRNTHENLDRAVRAAYGWDDPDPATVEEDAILARLLALNGERARVQQA